MERMNNLQGSDLDWVAACEKRDSKLARTIKVIQELEWHYQKNKVVANSIQLAVSGV
jgi:hypothetical protein